MYSGKKSDIFYSFFSSSFGDYSRQAKFVSHFISANNSVILNPFAGTGEFGLELAKLGFSSILLESSLPKYSVLLEKIASFNESKFYISPYPIDFLQLETSFRSNIIYISNSISYLSDFELELTIKNCMENLVPKGLLIFNFPQLNSLRGEQQKSLISKKILGECIFYHYASSRFNENREQMQVNFSYELTNGKKIVLGFEDIFRLHLRSMESLRGLVEVNNFTIVNEYSDWEFTPYSSNSATAIIVAQKNE